LLGATSKEPGSSGNLARIVHGAEGEPPQLGAGGASRPNQAQLGAWGETPQLSNALSATPQNPAAGARRAGAAASNEAGRRIAVTNGTKTKQSATSCDGSMRTYLQGQMQTVGAA
jgi:hypothetical protein